MTGTMVDSVDRKCGNGYRFLGRDIGDQEYGIVEDTDEGDCEASSADCRHGCYCNDDECNSAEDLSDCYSPMSGLQVFMVINACVLGVLFILVEVLFRIKQKKISQAIEGLQSAYKMKREDYIKARTGVGKKVVTVPQATVVTPPPPIMDKNEILPDFVQKI